MADTENGTKIKFTKKSLKIEFFLRSSDFGSIDIHKSCKINHKNIIEKCIS